MRFSWQAQGIVKLRGVTEVTFQFRGRHVDAESFVAGARDREVVSCGGGVGGSLV